MFFSRRNSNSPASTSSNNQAVALTNPNTSLTTNPNADLVFVGFEDGLKVLETKIQCPDRSSTNAVAMTNVTISAANAWYSDIADDTTQSLTLAGINLFVSGSTQLLEFYKEHKEIQELQEKFINCFNPGYIRRCYYGDTEMARPFEADKIIEFLRQHGYVTIEFNAPDSTFTLKYNGFCSLRLGVAAASAFSITAISTGIFVSYHIANQFAEESGASADETSMRVSLLLAGMPFTKVMGRLLDLCYKQKYQLLQAMQQVAVNIYQRRVGLDKVPENLFILLDNFLSREAMARNREIKVLFKERTKDVELGTLKDKVVELDDKGRAQDAEINTLKHTVTELNSKVEGLEEEIEETSKLLSSATLTM